MAQQINQVLHNRYYIRSLLGRQAGRRTYLARDLQTGLLVVIKFLLFDPDFTWQNLKLFEREAEVLKSLDHPAIPRYVDYFDVEFQSRKGFALVQSYVRAKPLQNWIKSGRTFSELELKAIAKQLLEILDYLHSRQPSVIHRDIKPSNILLSDRSGNSPGKVSLIDFGSVQTALHGGTVTVVGTYGYMPLEQFGGRAVPASDLYGLGTTLIYLATGQHPADLPQQDLQIEFEKFTNLSQPFIRWIKYLTEPSLSRRPTSAKEALQHLLKDSLPKTTTLSNQRFSLRTHPSSSQIQLKVTPKIIEMKIPSKQFSIESQDEITWVLFMMIPFLLPPLLELGLAGLLFFISICLFSYCIIRFWWFPKPESYHITFFLEDELVFTSLSASNSMDLTNFSELKLQAAFAGPYQAHKDRLQLIVVRDSDEPRTFCDNFYISGSHREIQWLCDELNKWSGLPIKYKDFSKD